jgi:hypothetical protein
MRGIANYAPQLRETFGGAQVLAGRLAQKVGAEETGSSLIGRGVENLHKAESKTVTRKTDEFMEALKEGIVPLVTDWLPYQMGSGVANLAETLGVMAAGAGVGAATGAGVGALPGAISGAIAKTLVKKGIIEEAKKLGKDEAEKLILKEAKKQLITMGSAAGMGGQAVLHGAGETTSRAVQEAQNRDQTPEDINLGRLVPAAIVHSVADFFANKIGVNALKVGDKAADSLIAEVAKRIAVTGGKEILPEEIQTVAERFGADLSVADSEALIEYVNTAAAAVGMSVVPGTVGGVRSHINNKFAKAAREQAERERQQQQTPPPPPATTTPAAPPTPAEAAAQAEFNSLLNLQNAPPGAAPTTTAPPTGTPPGTPPTGVAPTVTTPGTPPPTNLPPAENKEQLAAFNYLQGLVADPSKQPVPSFLKKHLEKLGIEVDSKAPNFRATALQAIADKLTAEGVTVPDLAPIIANLPQSKKAEAAGQTGVKPPKEAKAPTAPVVVTPEAIAAAQNYVATTDQTALKQSDIRQTAKALDVKIPFGTKNADAFALIQNHLASLQGAPNAPTGTVEAPAGASPSVATQPSTGTSAEGTTAPDTSGVGDVAPSTTATDAGEGTKPAPVVPLVAADVNLQDLDQTDRNLVTTQREVYNKIAYAYAKDPSKINAAKLKDALADLHQLEDDFDISRSDPLTENDTFFAEPIGPFRSRDEQRATADDYALSLEREETRKQEEQRQRDLEASYLDEKGKPRGPLKYSFDTDEMQNQYTQTYGEVAAEAKEKNAIRVELEVAKDEAQAKFDAAQEKAQKIETELKAAREQNDESRVQELEKEQEKADNEEADASAALAEAEVSLERHGNKLSQLPPWSKLSAAEKDLYFSLIKYGNRPEHREAGRKLQAYRALTSGRETYSKSEEDQARKERDQRRERVTNNYEYNRDAVSKYFKFEFPTWSKLSHAAKLAYLQALSEKGDTNEAGVQQDYAFAKVAERLINENNKLTSKEKAKALIDHSKRVAEMIGAGIAAQEKFQRQRDTAEPYVPFSRVVEDRPLSAEAVKLIKDNELQKLLQAFRSAPTGGNLTALVHKGLAQALFAMKLSTTFEIVDVIRDNKGRETDAYGSYDPLTNKIRLAPNGLTMSTVLHELTHAATVQVLYKYSHGNQLRSQLTEDQILACFQLEQLMEEAKDYLGKSYPTAFKNVYEFIAYAMTEPQFQRELNRISPSAMGAMKASNIVAGAIHDKLGKEPGKVVGKWREWTETLIYESLLPTARTLWSSLSRAIAKAVGYNAEKQANGQINFLVEVSEIFSKIAMPQQGAIDLGRLEATAPATPTAPATGPQPNQATPLRTIDLNNYDDPNYTRFKEDKVPLAKAIKDLFTTKQGFTTLATKFANNRYAIKSWEVMHERAKLIEFAGPKINAIYTLLTLAPARGRSIYNSEVDPIATDLRASIEQYAKAMNINVDQALSRLHKIMEVLHNPERSLVKFLLSAPLDNSNKSFMVNNKPATAADVRTAIMKQLNSNQTMTEAQARQLRSTLESIVFQTQVNPFGQVEIVRDASGNPVVNAKNVVANGFSPDGMKEISPTHQTYNMTNLDPVSMQNVVSQYQNDPNKAIVNKIISDMRRLNEKTIELDKQSNYWSKPVENRKNFYNFQNYVSFKGKDSQTETDEMLDFQTMKRGKDFQQIERPFQGRETAADNPILHAMAYATQAALRAGRKDVTLAIKNAIEKKLIAGQVWKEMPFEDRNTKDFIDKLPRERTVFHFNPNGSIQVLIIDDPKIRESIRRTFESSSPFVTGMNWLTSKVGAMHTRYNFNFAPMNFVRDALTNAGAIGADMGPKKSAEYLGAMSSLVANGGLYKAMQVAILYDKTDAKSQQALKGLAASDPFIGNMVEFIKEGGMVSYLHGLTIKSNFEQLYKEIGRSGIIAKKEQLEKFIDTWTDMFELASRAAAYSVAKSDATANGYTGDAAKAKAAAYAKNLANFEQVGDWGKALGALYMFFRPSATGALRAIEAIAPAFRTTARAKQGLPESVSKNPVALANFEANYAKNRANAQIMSAGLMGLGALAYTMAFMFADDDDDLGRNPVGTDNMQQWTRYARFHVPKILSEAIGLKDPLVLQMPWGFGLGAFAASGAQLAAAVAGKQGFGDALANIFLQISLDSFVPIPISRMPPTEMPGAFALDSIAPSVLRPVFEFIINKNGLGQEIYNDQNRRMGDAYTGGDHIPEMYKMAARWMANSTVGDIDISPNTLYFLSNSYLDGIAKYFETGTDVALVLGGEKDFKPKVDLPLFGSFFGSRSNVDSREYSAVEKKIQDIESKLKQFDTDPLMSAKYDIKHPLHRTLVEMYNHDKNQELRELRHQAKEIRLNPAFSPKDRDAMVKIINLQQNLVKRNMIEIYKAYGVEP